MVFEVKIVPRMRSVESVRFVPLPRGFTTAFLPDEVVRQSRERHPSEAWSVLGGSMMQVDRTNITPLLSIHCALFSRKGVVILIRC